MRMMASITYDSAQREVIAPLIPAEQARVKELMEQGLIDALYIAADQSNAWLVMQGESQEQIQQALDSLPLSPYATVHVTPIV